MFSVSIKTVNEWYHVFAFLTNWTLYTLKILTRLSILQNNHKKFKIHDLKLVKNHTRKKSLRNEQKNK